MYNIANGEHVLLLDVITCLTNARSIVIVHEKRNSCLLELVVIINFYGGEKIRGRENGEKATAGL